MNAPSDVDRFAFRLEKGQTVACEVMASRLGSPLDARLELRDAEGTLLATDEDTYQRDPLLIFTAPQSGDYTLVLHDIAFKGGAEYVYRLTVTTAPYVEFAFPAGGQRGTTSEVTFFGRGLNGGRVRQLVKFDSANEAQTAQWNGGSNPVTFAVGDLPEVIEAESNNTPAVAQKVTLPITINGQLAKVGDADCFAFTAAKGAAVTFEVFAQRLGSPVDSVLTIFSSDGKQLARSDDIGGATDSRLDFTAPADGAYVVRVEDLHRAMRGGENFVYRLEARPPTPDFRLTAERDFVNVPLGKEAALKVVVARNGGFNGVISLEFEGLPRGVNVEPKTIPANQNQISLTFKASADADFRGATVRVVGVAEKLRRSIEAPLIGGMMNADALMVKVEHPPMFTVTADDTYTFFPRGVTRVNKLSITREAGFNGEIVLTRADTQPRELYGLTIEPQVVPPNAATFDCRIFPPETMPLQFTSRSLVMGVGVCCCRAGEEHHLLWVSQKQNVMRMQPSLMAFKITPDVVQAKPGDTVELTATVQRVPQLKTSVRIELVLTEGMTGVTCETTSMPEDARVVKLILKFAPDADVGTQRTLKFRVTGSKDGMPIVSETEVEVELVR
jgi:hypothetical protein